MHIPTIQDVHKLLQVKASNLPNISVYMPTYPSSSPEHVKADKTRFNNVIHDTEKELNKLGLRRNEIHTPINKLKEIHENTTFWRHRNWGLAVFLSKNKLFTYDLPVEVEQFVYAGKIFTLAPLIAVASLDTDFYLLDINQTNPRFFKGDMAGMKQILEDKMPENRQKALRIESYEEDLQFHDTVIQGNQTTFHGHGGAKDQAESEIINYLRLIEDIVYKEVLHNKQDPLILAGIEKLVSEFRKLSRYENLHETELPGGAENMHPNVLHGKVWDILFSMQIVRTKLFADRFLGETKPERKIFAKDTSRQKEILDASQEGKVGALIIDILRRTHDSIVGTYKVAHKIRSIPLDKARLQYERIIQSVINHGGTIYPAEYAVGEAPDWDMAAVLRY